MHKIINVEPLSVYKLEIAFSDGVRGVIDLSELVGQGVFQQWKDPKKFFAVAIDPQTHTLAWPGGIDLCPDALYEDILKAKS
jgi:hypothetical protein